MRRVLIVSPHFPPVNAPDMQRVRLALPHLRALGWEPVVLAVEPALVEGAVLDPLLEKTYPADIRVIRVRGLSQHLTRRFGFGSLWLRCGRALCRAGERLLANEKFDLVFFTTTQFDAFTLGPRWLRRFGVPYVLDYQDPWVNDYYKETGMRPPGGKLKFWFSQFTARRNEPAAVRAAAGIISVSSSYGPDLLKKYPGLDPARIKHLPFGAATNDFTLARCHLPAHSLVPFGDGNIHFVYAGRCGPDMTTSLTLVFRAFRMHLEHHPDEAQRMRFHFIGTDYAPPPLGRFWANPIAEQVGVQAYVTEHCYRVPYFDALYYLINADALLAVGSNDPTYSASKIFPYLFARRPLLTVVHKDSLMLHLARTQQAPCSYGFAASPPDSPTNQETVVNIHREWFVERGYCQIPSGIPAALTTHTAESMSDRLVALFNQSLATPAT